MIAALIASQLAATPVMPYSWLEACSTQSAMHCEVSTITPEAIYYINVSVNAVIRPVADEPGVEHWTAFPTDRRGDCSEYVMTKRAALIALGMDPSRLTIELGEHLRDKQWRKHMVLQVRMNDRTWILDNISDKPYQPDARPLPWRSIAAQSKESALWTMPQDK